jgi:hypothetical protein
MDHEIKKKKKKTPAKLIPTSKRSKIILGKRLYKNHLNHKESSQHNFTKVQVPLEQ